MQTINHRWKQLGQPVTQEGNKQEAQLKQDIWEKQRKTGIKQKPANIDTNTRSEHKKEGDTRNPVGILKKKTFQNTNENSSKAQQTKSWTTQLPVLKTETVPPVIILRGSLICDYGSSHLNSSVCCMLL